MKPRRIKLSSIIVFAIAIGLTQQAFPQSSQTRPRRVGQLAYNSDSNADRSAGTSEGAAMDSLLPRTGLQFYMEVRGAGLAQIAQSGGAAGPLMKLVARPAFGSAGDLAAFAAAQMGTLSRAKLAFVSYGAEGSAALIEAANGADAESLRGGVSRLIT